MFNVGSNPTNPRTQDQIGSDDHGTSIRTELNFTSIASRCNWYKLGISLAIGAAGPVFSERWITVPSTGIVREWLEKINLGLGQ